MFPKFSNNSKGQALVEFALILVVLLLFIFIIIEAGRLFQGYLTLQNSARAAGRYAMTGQFETDCLFETPACLDARLTSIKRESRRNAGGLAIDDLALAGERNSFVTEVWSYNNEGVWEEDETGGSGDPIDIIVRFRMPVITPLLRPIADSVPLTARIKVVAENFDQVGVNENSVAPPAPGNPGGGGTPEADVAISKTASESVVLITEPIDYTITIWNNGPFDAEETITIVDTLPPGNTYQGFSIVDRDLSCDEDPVGSGIVTCVMPNLDKDAGPDNSASVIIHTTAPSVAGQITNTVTVYPGNTTVDPDLDNNTAEVGVTVRWPYADLSVEITDDPDPVNEGGVLTYEVTVANQNWEDATGVVMTATLSPETTPVSVVADDASVTCNVVGLLVTCTAPNLALNDDFIVTIVVNANISGGPAVPRTISMSASVYGNELDPDMGNNTATEETNIADNWADLIIRKRGPSGPVPAMSPFWYTLVITNPGSNSVLTSTIVDDLPADVNYTGAYSTLSPGVSCTPGPGHAVTCNMGGLGSPSDPLATDPSTKRVEIQVIPTIATLLTNQATVSAELFDPNETNNTDTADTSVGQANLTINKYAPLFINAGDPLTYTLVVTNNGPDVAPGVRIVDDLPPNVTIVSVSPSITCQPSGGTQYNCGPYDLTPGQVATATFVAIAPDQDLIVNRARTFHDLPDLFEPDNSVVVTTSTNLVADVEIFKFDETDYDRLGREGLTGEQLRYLLQVGSSGPSPATGLRITDTLPASVEFASVSPQPECSYLPATHQVECDMGDLVLGPTVSIRIHVTPTLPGPITNTAIVTSTQIDNSSLNNTTSAAIEILPADLEIQKFATASVLVSDTITYTLVISSVGPSDAHEVVITDTLPVSVTSATAVASQGVCDDSGNPVVCTLDELAVGDAISITMIVTATAEGLAINEAATRAKDTIEVDVAQATTVINPVTDLAIAKSASGVFYAGEPLTYTLTVTNFGPSVARSVRVTDTLPSDVSNISASSPGGNCGVSGGVVNCTLTLIPIDGIETVVISTTAGLEGDYFNTASVGSDAHDPDLLNNTTGITTTILPAADLGIIKSHSGDFFAGEPFFYTLDVFNGGPSTAVGVVITDTLPDDVTPALPPPAGCNYLAGSHQLVCLQGDLAAGATTSVQIQVSTNVSGFHYNEAETQSATEDLHQTALPNIDSQTTFIRPVANLTIEKANATGATLPAVAGTSHTYAITVSNAGPNIATGLIITDVLPAGMSYVSSTGVCADLGAVVSCTVGTLNPGASASLELSVDIASSVADGITLTNVAYASADQADRDGNGNQASADTPIIRQVDTTISKTNVSEPAVAGTTHTYSIVVTNNGPSDASSVTVTDTLPAGTSYFGSSIACDASVSCTLPVDLTNGDSFTFTLEISLTSSLPESPPQINNWAFVSAAEQEIPGAPNSDNELTTIVRWTDLEIEKFDESQPATIGEEYTYTLLVTNHGPSDASGVAIDDLLPVDTSFVTGSVGFCAGDGRDVICDLGDIPNGSSTSVTVTIFVSTTVAHGTTLFNSASVSGHEVTDPDPGNNDVTIGTLALGRAELSISKTDIGEPAIAGGEIDYQITINNAGPSDATAIAITDILPAEMSYVSSSIGCGAVGQIVTCTPADLGAGLSTAFIITVRVSPGASHGLTVTNWVEVSAEQVENDDSDNIASEVTLVEREADLAIDKTDTGSPAVAGATYTYAISVTNEGPSDASGVTVTDTLPAGTTYASSTGDICGLPLSPGQQRSCFVGDLALNATTSFTIAVNVDASLDVDDELLNRSGVFGNENDPVSGNDTDEVTTSIVRSADLSVQKSDEGTEAIVGLEYTYDILVSNAGASDASGVTVTDTLPLSTTFVSASPGCSESGGVVTCSVGVLADGGSLPLTVTIELNSTIAHGDFITNSVLVGGDEPDPDSGNDSDSVSTQVIGNVDLSISKTDFGVTAIASEEIIYQITVDDIGGLTDASGVVVTDTLPAEMVLASPGGICGPVGGQVITCNVGDMSQGSSVTFNITATVLPDAGDNITVTNQATVGAEQYDAVQGNNTITETTRIQRVADLAISKTGAATGVAGASHAYTVTVENIGPSDASNVILTDTLPSGTSPSGVLPLGCTDLGASIICNLNSLTVADGPIDFRFDLLVNADAPAGTITNTADVIADEFDPNDLNNHAQESTVVDRVAGLSLEKSDGGLTPVVGELFTYIITVTNSGPSSASFVVITDTLPVSTTFNSFNSSNECALDSGDVICSLTNPIAPSTSEIVTIAVDIDPDLSHGATITNSAVVTAAEDDLDIGDNVASVISIISGKADLAIKKVGDALPAIAGGVYSYTVTITNGGPSDATGVTVVDTLLPSLASFAGGPGFCSGSAQTYTCDFGNLNNGDSTSFEIGVLLDSSFADGAVLTNTVVVDADQRDLSTGDNTDVVNTTVNRLTDLTITKNGVGPTATAGDAYTYDLQVDNIGDSDASGVVVTDTLPISTTFAGSSPGGTCLPIAGTLVRCTIGDLASQDSANFSITVNVDENVAHGATMTNTAVVQGNENEADTGNNDASEETTVNRSSELSISKEAVNDAVAGTVLTYTITVENLGPSNASGIVVTDVLPAFSSNPVAAGCVDSGGDLVCDVGELDDGASVDITLSVLLDEDIIDGTSITNTVSVEGDEPDPGLEPNTADAVSVVSREADLAIAKAGTGANAIAGETYTYTLTVTNTGPSRASGIEITDILPAEASFISSTDGCIDASGTLTCSAIDLAVDESDQITVTVDIASSAGHGITITNEATVAANEPDLNGTNDTATLDTLVERRIDLEISKSALPATAIAGDSLQYTVNIHNNGPSDASNVTFTDTLPISTTMSQVPGCSPVVGGEFNCTALTLGAGDDQQYVFNVDVDAAVGSGTILSNSVVVSADELDTNSGNDTFEETTPVVREADLEIAKSGPVSVLAGATMSYTLVITNNGPSLAGSVFVSDTLPAILTNTVASTTSGSCDVDGSLVTCNLFDLSPDAPGNTATIIITTKPITDSIITNTATVSAAVIDPVQGNNSDSLTTTVLPAANIQVFIPDDPIYVAGKDIPFTVTLEVLNNGPSIARDVVVTESLSVVESRLVFDDLASYAGCSRVIGTSVISCVLPDLNPGQFLEVDIVLEFSNVGGLGLIPHTAEIAASTQDPVTGNNSNSGSIIIGLPPGP